MAPNRRTYRKKQGNLQDVQSARPLRLAPWYYSAVLLSDRGPVVVTPVLEVRTLHDLPEAEQRRIRRKAGEVARAMRAGVNPPGFKARRR